MAVKATRAFHSLTLQKPYANKRNQSKPKLNCRHLKHRFKLWVKGGIPSFLEERRAIQQVLFKLKHTPLIVSIWSRWQKARVFAKEGKVKVLMLYFPLLLMFCPTWSLKILLERLLSVPTTLITSNSIYPFHFIYFDSLDGDLIFFFCQLALSAEGAAGVVDASTWKRLCMAFHSSADEFACLL